MAKVMIHPATYENVHQAVDRAFEFFPLKLQGKKVLIKPNVLRVSEAKEGIVTHPAVLRAVVEKVEANGPASSTVERSCDRKPILSCAQAAAPASISVRYRLCLRVITFQKWMPTLVLPAFVARKSVPRKPLL